MTNVEVPAGDLTGRRVLVTGANSGIGRELAGRFAAAGAEVIMAVRDLEKGRAAAQQIERSTPGATLRLLLLDLASLTSVAGLAETLIGEGAPLDILVNNAGVMALPERQVTAEGHEMQVGSNYLGHFALTAHLLPLLRAADGSRVVSMSSVGRRLARTDLDDLQGVDYQPHRQYLRSKLALLLFARELDRRSRAGGWGVGSIAAHPGFTISNLQVTGPGPHDPQMRFARLTYRWKFMWQQPGAGALPALYAATSPDARSGAFYGPAGTGEMTRGVKPAKVPPPALDQDSARRLWALSEDLTDVRFPA
ncbi:SDR family oxidoreductase [Actinoplanes bogorensis]|uniref:SDR family oxidoreductase n=1 Tax=Paractinoplanes bogorensis TaxID=1610840 RepID=A0ABS5Z4A0_9ACTN|nr:SDR family oxidoreductase [Actinoplanes bogorensis]